MSDRIVTVACGQIQPVFGETIVNIHKMIELIKAYKPDLMVFPELATSGYDIPNRAIAKGLAFDVQSSVEMFKLKQCAQENGTYVAFGFPESSGDKLYNSSVLIEPNGKVHTYRKIHLFDREKNLFDPGDIPLTVIDTEIGRLGMMICFDWVFPEVARTLALKGAQVLIHPSNLVLQYCQKAMYARSVENGVFSITCNRVGSETQTDRTLTFTGASQILSNRGEIIAQAGTRDEQVIKATITPSLAENKMLTKLNNIFDDRRVEFYSQITAQPDNQ